MLKKEYKGFIAKGYKMQQDARLELQKLLAEYGPVEFNPEVADAPSIVSHEFSDDVTECYVKKLYVVGEIIYADLCAYYMEEEKANVDISKDHLNVDWLGLLDWVTDKVL